MSAPAKIPPITTRVRNVCVAVGNRSALGDIAVHDARAARDVRDPGG
jgi:hypothetical protein